MHNTNQTNQTEQQKLLKSWIHVAALADQYPDCTATAEKVYSYMLCKYVFFNKRKQLYFESQEEIARGARTSVAPTKLAIKWLKENKLIDVTKKKGSLHFNNQYVVHDRYGIYKEKQTLEPPRPSWIDDDEEPPPF